MTFRIALVQTTDRLINQLQQNIKQAIEPIFQKPNGAFISSLSGFTTSLSPKVTWQQGVLGCSITLSFPAISGTSNKASMIMSGLPKNLWPSTNQVAICRIVDNGTTAFGFATVMTTGTIEFASNAAGSGFTASGTKGTESCCITYVGPI